MYLGKVVGNVVCSVKDDALVGIRCCWSSGCMGVARLLPSTPSVRAPAKPFMFAVERKPRSRSRGGKCLPKPPSSRLWMTCSGWNEGS